MRIDLLEAFELATNVIADLKVKSGEMLLPVQERAFKDHRILNNGNFPKLHFTSIIRCTDQEEYRGQTAFKLGNFGHLSSPDRLKYGLNVVKGICVDPFNNRKRTVENESFGHNKAKCICSFLQVQQNTVTRI